MSVVSYHGWDQRYAGEADRVVHLVREIAESGEFILKSNVVKLEEEVATQVGVRHAVACANGTAALSLILTGMGIGPGQEVITPAFSFISSASTIALCGARPVFVDVDERTYTLDPAAARAAITPKTTALLPAHLFNSTADMPTLRALANGRGVRLIEDSAISLGATINGVPAGKHGDAGAFSFYPGKPLGGIGDAGMVVTDDDDLAMAARMLRNHGQRPGQRFLHERVGFNCRMDELSAGYLLGNLPRQQELLDTRRERAQWYTDRLSALVDVVLPPVDFAERAVYTFVIRAQQRDRLREYLAARGIETAVYYPKPLHVQPVFAHLGHRYGDFPVAEQISREALALPLRPDLSRTDIDRVSDAVLAFYGGVA